MNYKKIKTRIYQLARALGLFHLSKFLYRDRLRILCYHGVSFDDEHLWHPGLFIRFETLKRRLALLARQRYPVLTLDEALIRLREGSLPRQAVVITFDDGFHNNFALALPLLQSFGFPFTIYTSSYYVVKSSPVFRLVVQYMLWKTQAKSLEISLLHPCLSSRSQEREVRDLTDTANRLQVQKELIQFGEETLSNEERDTLLKSLGEALHVDFDSLRARRLLSFMTPDELRAVEASGLGSIELHTHRHRHLDSIEGVADEILENQRVLEPIVGRELRHFCYPSGVWSSALWPALERLGIRSATTCHAQLNTPQTSRYGLGRFLDGENISDIEFEAELAGFSELLRRCLAPTTRGRRWWREWCRGERRCG